MDDQDKDSFAIVGGVIVFLALILFLVGCQSIPEASREKVIEAALEPGKDSRCIEVLGFKGCYTKERTEQ